MVSETVIESRIKVINLPPRVHYLSVLVSDENVEHGGRWAPDELSETEHSHEQPPAIC